MPTDPPCTEQVSCLSREGQLSSGSRNARMIRFRSVIVGGRGDDPLNVFFGSPHLTLSKGRSNWVLCPQGEPSSWACSHRRHRGSPHVTGSFREVFVKHLLCIRKTPPETLWTVGC